MFFLEVREDERTINRVAKYLEKQNEVKKSQLASVIDYVLDEKSCKSVFLLNYFGETIANECGVCSYCVSKNKVKVNREDVSNTIRNILSEKPMTSREIVTLVQIEEKEVLAVLQQMLEYQIVSMNLKNQFTLNK